ncbi:MAG: hypothetical protein ACYS22_12070 [Planctomycetota bacterium]
MSLPIENAFAPASVAHARLTRHLPQIALRRDAGIGEPLGGPWTRSFEASALFADISGFSALTEQLAAKGEQGLEELMAALRRSRFTAPCRPTAMRAQSESRPDVSSAVPSGTPDEASSPSSVERRTAPRAC